MLLEAGKGEIIVKKQVRELIDLEGHFFELVIHFLQVFVSVVILQTEIELERINDIGKAFFDLLGDAFDIFGDKTFPEHFCESSFDN